MPTSGRRVLTTHAGSRPAREALARLLIERDHERPVDAQARVRAFPTEGGLKEIRRWANGCVRTSRP
jgi:hypothetical protein